MLHDRSRSLDKQSSEIPITPFADAKQFLSAAGGVLPWHHPYPGGQVSTSSELRTIADRRHQSCRGDRPDSRYRHESLASVVVCSRVLDKFIHLFNSLAELHEFLASFRSDAHFQRIRSKPGH